MDNRSRIYELDFLRIVASIAVVFFHYTFRGNAADNMSILNFDEISGVTRYGYLGVDLFFMISGFVILLTASFRDAAGFAVARFFRLYPVFWICVTITFSVALLMGGDLYRVGLFQYLVNLTLIARVFGVENIDGTYWSLLVEIKFYTYIFFILLIQKLKKIMWFFNIWCALSVLNLTVPLPYMISFFVMPTFASYFISGACFYLARVDGYRPNHIVLLVISFVMAIAYALMRSQEMAAHYNTHFSAVAVALTVTAYFTVFYILSRGSLNFINKSSMMIWGGISYPLYLLHQNIGFMLFNEFGVEVNKWVMLACVLLTVVTASHIINSWVEKLKRGNPGFGGTNYRRHC